MIQATHCQDCVFKVLDPAGVQSGCFVQEIDPELHPYDVVDGTFQFRSKLCQYARSQTWAKSIVREEVKLTYKVILTPQTLTDAISQIDNMIGQSLPPSHILIMVGPNQNLHDQIQTFIKYQHEDNKIPWEIEMCLEDNPGKLIPTKVLHSTEKFVWRPNGFIMPLHFFEWLDEQINENDFRFRSLQDSTGDAWLISPFVFKNQLEPFTDFLSILKRKEKTYAIDSLSEYCDSAHTWSAKCGAFQPV